LLDISGQPLEEEEARDVWWERRAGVGEEALEVVKDFCGGTVVRGVRRQEGA